MILGDDHSAEFAAAAQAAMRSGSGAEVLDSLGWWDLLDELDDPEARVAVFAAFRAQGRELGDTPALGAIVAHAHLAAAGEAGSAGSAGEGSARGAVAVLERTSRRGAVRVLLGDPGDRPIVVDAGDRGVVVVGADRVVRSPVDVPGRLAASEVAVDLDGADVLLDGPAAEAARIRARQLGRLAAASEIVGAAEAAVDLAVRYAADREQFGSPIGTFQAVRHLLAWAATDCTAVDSVLRRATELLADLPDRFDDVAKAIAGRNGRRACERSLQVLGGIGFTAEHVHHHHHSRVLLLDALLGSSAELTAGLGAWLRTGIEPGFAAAVVGTPP